MPPVARVYLRNSSDRQAKAATIRAQRPDCGALAERLGLVAVEYVDEGVSGAAPLEERPGLRRLLGELGPGDVVIAFALDRLSRSDDEIERAAVYGAIRRAGARVETVTDGAVDSTTFGGRVLHAIRQEVAAEERRKIGARTAAGKRTAAAAGKKPQGATPFGLRYDRAAGWSLDEPRAAVVRQAFAGVIAGKSCAEVAASLPRPAPRSSSWGARGVWQLVTRRTYLGEWHFGGAVIRVPAIVDAGTWQAAQAALLASGRRGLRRTSHVYLCDEGVGRCGECGGPLRVKWGGRLSRTSYYLCANACGNGWHRTERIDAEVWQRIQVALLREDLVGAAAASEHAAQEDARLGAGDAAGFARRLEQLERHEAAVLARHRRGLVSDGAMDRELGLISAERRMLEQSAAAARAAASRAREDAVSLQGVQEAARLVAKGMGRMEEKERRGWMRELRAEVLVGPEVRVRFRLVAGVSCAVGGCSSARTTAESDTIVGDEAPGGIVVVA